MAALEGVKSQLAEVRVQDSESIESALRRFKRKVQQEDIIKDIKKHSFYLKPGDKRRAKAGVGQKAEPQEDAAGRRITPETPRVS